MHLTSNEWQSAQQARAHVFYLWRIAVPAQLAAVSVADMEPHVATNNGNGAWESLRIPYRAFGALFEAVEPV